MSASATIKAVISLLLISTPSTISQTWEQSNDPDNLCSDSFTGYKATLDCRGYVYCNAGYLMGGDVIPCWPNQLFDEVTSTCTTWQSVTESLGDDISWRCPEYNGDLMMPDDKDGNANPKLFFCGSSTFNAKSVCEPCPGGIRTECSNPSHNCYAGITGCPTSSNPSPTTAGSPSKPNPPPVTPQPTPNPTPNPTEASAPDPTPYPTPNPTPNPTEASVEEIELANASSDSENESDALDDSLYLHGKLRTSYYCGFSWDLVVKTCNMAHPCPSGLNNQCPMGQFCFPDTPCHELQTPPPSPNPTPKPTTITEATYYCGPDWSWVVANCDQAVPCPYGDGAGVCPEGHKCIADTPCDRFNIVGPNSSKPTPRPTRGATYPPVEGDDPQARYCGHDWADVTENCLTAIPCPEGVATGVCPWEMNCIAETPCNDEVYLDWLRDKQAKLGAAAAEAENSAAATTANDETFPYCMDNDDCDTGLMCNKGYCSECLDDGTGCTVDQVCKPATCGVSQVPGKTQCFTVSELDAVCQSDLNDERAVCVIDVMGCEVPVVSDEQDETNPEEEIVIDETSDTEVSNESFNGAAMFENPDGNTFFCGDDYYAIKAICLQSKPCPGGFAAGACESHQGCFSVVECQSEYEAAGNGVNSDQSASTPAPVTNNPSSSPTRSPLHSSSSPTTSPHATISEPIEIADENDSMSNALNDPTAPQNPTNTPSVGPTVKEHVSNEPTNENNSTVSMSPTETITSAPTKPSANFCGVTWSSHIDDCENARPCPNGDECKEGETCFSDSPCVSFGSDSPMVESNVKHLCGTDWNTLLNECQDATPCPKGDECPKGEMCYRNFECDPPEKSSSASNEELSGAFEASINNDNTQVVVNGQDLMKSNETVDNAQSNPVPENASSNAQSSAKENESTGTNVKPEAPVEPDDVPAGLTDNSETLSETSTASTEKSEEPIDDEVSPPGKPENKEDGTQQSDSSKPDAGENIDVASNAVEKGPEEAEPTTLKHCDICGSAGTFDYNANVNYEGFGDVNEMACGELIWIFAKNGIYEGSNACISSRTKYFGQCCVTVPQNACELCSPNHDYYLDKTSLFRGSQTACSRINTFLSSNYEMSSKECSDAKKEHAYDCCFQTCTICGDNQPNWQASVSFSGEDLKCNEFDIMFREEGVTTDSSRCQMTQDLYSSECCLQPLDSPCDICQTKTSGMRLKSGESTVSYEGDLTTCTDVYTHLFSMVEQSSEQCARAQQDLVDGCCESIVSGSTDTSYASFDGAPASPTTTPVPPQDGAQSPSTLSANWYAGDLGQGTPSASTMHSRNRWIDSLLTIAFLLGFKWY